MPKKIEISHKTIFFIAAFSIVLWLLFQIRQVLLGLFIALVLMSALNPFVRKLEKKKVPRFLAIIIIYLGVLLSFGIAIGGLVPSLLEQTTNLVNSVPEIFNQFKIFGLDEKTISSQIGQLSTVPVDLIRFLINIFSNIFEIFIVAVMTFYLLLERNNLDHYLEILFDENVKEHIMQIIDKIENRLGGWIRGQLMLMIITGVLAYLGFTIIGIKFSLPLAILAAVFEIIPGFGSTIAAIPAIVFGLTISSFHGLAVAAWIFLFQQLQNTIILPRIMKQVAGVNPLISIISLTVGLKLAGLGGAILAIPTYIILEVIASEISSSKKFKEG